MSQASIHGTPQLDIHIFRTLVQASIQLFVSLPAFGTIVKTSSGFPSFQKATLERSQCFIDRVSSRKLITIRTTIFRVGKATDREQVEHISQLILSLMMKTF